MKILFLPGWDHRYYADASKNTSEYRSPFLTPLREQHEVTFVAWPGFFHEPEPDAKKWTLDDYAEFVEDRYGQEDYDVVIGYSFGGAVALRWKKYFAQDAKLFLVAPALVRKYQIEGRGIMRRIASVVKRVSPALLSFLRGLYLRYVVKNPYYKTTPFLQLSYLEIVKTVSIDDLHEVNPEDVLLVYGEQDTATPPALALDSIDDPRVRERVVVLGDGDHDVGETHIDEVVNLLVTFLSKK